MKWNEMQKKHCKMIQFLASFSKIQKDFCKISKTIKHKMHHCCQQQYFGHQIFLVRNQIKNLRYKISTNFGGVKKIIGSSFHPISIRYYFSTRVTSIVGSCPLKMKYWIRSSPLRFFLERHLIMLKSVFFFTHNLL